MEGGERDAEVKSPIGLVISRSALGVVGVLDE